MSVLTQSVISGSAPPITVRKLLLLLPLLIAVVASPIFLLHLIDKKLPLRQSDLTPRWVGTRAALEGRNPYSAEVLRETQTVYYGAPLSATDHRDPQLFLYPAPLILFLAPLAPFSLEHAQLIFVLVAAPLLMWSLWLCLESLGLEIGLPRKLVILLLAFFSWPVMWGVRLLQPTLLIPVLIFVAFTLLRRGHAILPGILLAMAMIKPQLVLPLMLWLLLWSATRRCWFFLGSVAGTLVFLWYATERIVPQWFSAWRASLRGYTGLTRSSLPLEGAFGHWAGLILTAALAISCGLLLCQLRRCSPQSKQFGAAVSLALAATLVVVPDHVLMIYNNVIVFPACLLLVFSKSVNRWTVGARVLALGLFAWDLAIPVVAAIGAAAIPSLSIWKALPFLDDLLPCALTLFLIANADLWGNADLRSVRTVSQPLHA